MSAGQHILIVVEDDPITADLYQRKFTAEQFRVELAGARLLPVERDAVVTP